MKNRFSQILIVAAVAITLSSCYSLTYNVGNGPSGGEVITEKNHFLIVGLAAVKVSDPTKMAGGAKDYQVTIEHSFIDGLLSAITGGLYTPTTTIVRK